MLSGPGLVLYVLTVTFMSVDWIMSLDPAWYSTIFGILTIGGQGLSTMAFTIIVLSGLVKFQPMSRVANPDNFHDLGKLMFAFVMLWAYFSVSQLLIIWSANLPEEIPFYLERLHGPWAPISIAILLLQFVLPFLMLLSRDLKRNPAAVQWVALLILVMRVVDITWTIGPVFRTRGRACTGSTSPWCSRWARCGSRCSGAIWPGVRSSRRTTRTSRKQWLMADTKHVHGAAPIEGDGVSYSGIVWFVVILTVTTVACQLIVWGVFEFMEWRVDRGDAARAPLAAERAAPGDQGRPHGHEHPGVAAAGAARHRADRASGASRERDVEPVHVRMGRSQAPAPCGSRSIARKTLLLERGLPTRPGALRPATPTAAPAASRPRPASPRTGAWRGRTLRIDE